MQTDEVLVAHSRPLRDGGIEFHALDEHLLKVAALAERFASRISPDPKVRALSGSIASLAGLWHDLGKYRAGFQRYIRQSGVFDAHIENKVQGREKSHSAAGALWADRHLASEFGNSGQIVARIMQYMIAGHHAGLDNWNSGLAARLQSTDSRTETEEALAANPISAILAPTIQIPDLACIPIDRFNDIPGRHALWIRMMFSCLVDADFLDTESFMDADRSVGRVRDTKVSDLSALLDAHLDRFQSNASPNSVNMLRAAVLTQCRETANRPAGVFTLTVPTGGGKTLSSLAFALQHAIAHGKHRVIYAIPYTSIIEQTASVFRAIFGDENVIEHHSNAESMPGQETTLSRLACETWDAPLVITTNVQLFESLFARRTSRCRKLHNIANSVIVLDEAQLLPIEFLQPVLDVLRLLVRDYGVTLLFCTATQPTLTSIRGFDPRRELRGFMPEEITEIINDVPALYAALDRVVVHLPENLDESRRWSDIADDVLDHDAALVIVNRRADARELFGLLKTQAAEGLWHLSALMCPAHRTETITAIKSALAARRAALAAGLPASPVRVVSTQLVEAGVDIDFPVVFRAMAGLDSIAQAAGRCNREGLLNDKGQVYVFVPPSEPPPGLLRHARDACKRVLAGSGGDPLDCSSFQRYFKQLYANTELDKHRICAMLRVGKDGDVRFKDASEAFKLIDDKDSAGVIVHYPIGPDSEVRQWVGMLESGAQSTSQVRWLLRKLQRHTVTIYQYDLARLLVGQEVRALRGFPGLFVQESDLLYDNTLGANVKGAPGDPPSLVC